MSKTTSVRLDDDVDEWRQRECDNFSALVNTLVRQYKQGGQNEEVIRQYRKREIRAEIESLNAQVDAKESLLDELESAPDVDTENYKQELKEMTMVAPDPKTTPIQKVADKYDVPAKTVAYDLAGMHGKEVKDTHDFDY